MNEPTTKTFTKAIVDCLRQNNSELSDDTLRPLVAWVLGEDSHRPLEQRTYKPLPPAASRADMEGYLAEIRKVLPKDHDRIALVSGGATKIKSYVFEAPKLPEIRGASALLDWVNEVGLRQLCHTMLGNELGEQCIIYASGGGFLAFAPAELGEDLARNIEHCYTEHTLTANSVAVSATFSLLELRYGRLNFDENDKLRFWAEDFRGAWRRGGAERKALNDYYYAPEDIQADDVSDAALNRRFFHRKTFGELVTFLATMANRRRDERATHGEARSVPFYQLSPWDAKCDSSDVRSAIATITVGDEANPRPMSRASGFKRVAGQVVKNDEGDKDFARKLDWKPPSGLKERAWHHRWLDFLSEHSNLPYTQPTEHYVHPASDVQEIGGASDGYIGVIYADGNNVGRLIATLKTPQEYQAVSQTLSKVAEDAVLHALANHLQAKEVSIRRDKQHTQDRKKWVHPFEILTIGGDDLFVIVPGNKALEVAAATSAYFEKTITVELRKVEGLTLPKDALAVSSYSQRCAARIANEHDYTATIGLSAGVIIAQENAPIFFLRDLVEELLKNAKALAKENAKKKFYGGAIDFMVMKSITMVTDNITSFRRQALGDDGSASKRRLTARPYTWHEFAGLLQTVCELKKANVPRSQLYRLRRALDADAGAGITSSVMEYLYTRVRMSSAHGAALQTAIEQPWCWETPLKVRAGGLPPWMPLGEKGWETIWADLLEAYEMVPEKV